MKPPWFLNRWPDGDDLAVFAVLVVGSILVAAVLMGVLGGLAWWLEKIR